ncbi:MAG TPA: hypothetical protein PK993_05230, partial [Clostridia bacterium]|nr:hypothetical protein [Clostridia bacterium]
KIVEVCKKNKIEITGSVFNNSAEEIEKIVEVCRKNKIEITGSVFLKSAEEIEKIIEVCKKNKMEITGCVFLKTAEQIEKIVEICTNNKIEITGSVFHRSAEELAENIEFLKVNYGFDYLKPLIISKNNKNLKKVLPFLQEIEVLETLTTSNCILALTLDEIKERYDFVKNIGEEVIKSDKKVFNSIFGLSKKNYQKRVEKYLGSISTQKLGEEVTDELEDIELLDKIEKVQNDLQKSNEKTK